MANNYKLALTSSKPGKTKLMNFFNFNNQFVITDLPGYGYSQVSAKTRNEWQKELEKYLLNRATLVSLIQFIDGRHPIQKNDFQMKEWILEYKLPALTVITKTDYISKNELEKRISEIKKEFGGDVFPFAKGNRQLSENMLKELLSDKYKVEQ